VDGAAIIWILRALYMNNWIAELIVPIILGLFSVLFPYKPTKAITHLSFAELRHKYEKWELFALVPIFICWPLMTWMFGRLFQYLMLFEIDDNPRLKYQLFIDKDMWYIPAVILALALTYYPLELVYKIIFSKEEFAEYIHFTNLKHEYNGMKVFRPMAWAGGFIVVIMVFFMSDYYIKIWNFKIDVNDFKSTRIREYNFRQIKKISYVEYSRSGEDGKVLNQDPHYHLLFDDGNIWDTSTGLHDLKHQPDIISFLSSSANVRVDTLGVDPQ
jgi:hypothetical protein